MYCFWVKTEMISLAGLPVQEMTMYRLGSSKWRRASAKYASVRLPSLI